MSAGPKLDLTGFFLSISSAACFAMGIRPENEGSERPQVDLPLARQNIELLELLEVKTRGNRTSEEDQLLDQLLFEVRMKFVEIEKEMNSQDES